MKKTIWSVVVIVLILSSGCAPKAGVLRGRLAEENGDRPASEFTVLLCTSDPEDGTCRLNSRYQTTTIAGEFELRGVPVGQYGVYIISASGIGTLLLRDAGQPLIIELEKGIDFDLGIIHLRPDTSR